MTKRLHKCIICGTLIEDTRECRTEHFQKFHAHIRTCICNLCGIEIIDTTEERQAHTLMHLNNDDIIIQPLYTTKEKDEQYSEVIPLKKGVKAKKRCQIKKTKYKRKLKIRTQILYNAVETNRRKH